MSGEDDDVGAKAAATDVEERMARAARRGAVLVLEKVVEGWKRFSFFLLAKKNEKGRSLKSSSSSFASGSLSFLSFYHRVLVTRTHLSVQLAAAAMQKARKKRREGLVENEFLSFAGEGRSKLLWRTSFSFLSLLFSRHFLLSLSLALALSSAIERRARQSRPTHRHIATPEHQSNQPCALSPPRAPRHCRRRRRADAASSCSLPALSPRCWTPTALGRAHPRRREAL